MEYGLALAKQSSRVAALTSSELETLSDSEAEFENSYMRASAIRPFGWSYGSLLLDATRWCDSV